MRQEKWTGLLFTTCPNRQAQLKTMEERFMAWRLEMTGGLPQAQEIWWHLSDPSGNGLEKEDMWLPVGSWLTGAKDSRFPVSGYPIL